MQMPALRHHVKDRPSARSAERLDIVPDGRLSVNLVDGGTEATQEEEICDIDSLVTFLYPISSMRMQTDFK